MKRLYIWAISLLFTTSPAWAQSSLNIGKQQFKDQFLDAINTVRARGCNCGATYMRPVAPLTWNDVLASAAREHAMDMYRNNYFDHNSIDGRTMEDRLSSFGYTYNGYRSYAIGENIVEGQQTIDEVMAGWLKSVGHCKNLMNPNFKEIGIFEYNKFWVQDFGGRVSFSPMARQGSGKYIRVE